MGKKVKLGSLEILNEPFAKSTWYDAMENIYTKKKGWRLPTMIELRSLNTIKGKLNIETGKYYWSSEFEGESGRCLCIEDLSSARVKLLCGFPYLLVRDV
jgi:hypothetical protein